jgi:hypothetical protein
MRAKSRRYEKPHERVASSRRDMGEKGNDQTGGPTKRRGVAGAYDTTRHLT